MSAIDTVARGGSLIDPKIVEVLVSREDARRAFAPAGAHLREREVLAEIASGKSNTAIADSLVLTKRAVEKHINSIFMKLGLAAAEDVSKRVKATLLYLAQTDGDAPRTPNSASGQPSSLAFCAANSSSVRCPARAALPAA